MKITLPGKNLLVHTLDISGAGVRIGAIHEKLQPGQMVTLARGTQKAQFRIAWITQQGHEFHAGLEGVQVSEQFWGANLDAEENAEGEKAFVAVLKLAMGH